MRQRAGESGGAMAGCFKSCLVLTLMLLPVSCSEKRTITRQQMVGDYHAILDSGADAITLNNDGTFAEELTFTSGKKISNRGIWSLQGGSILLEGILAVGPDSPSPNGLVPRTSVVLPISQLFGKVRSFGADEWAVFEKI
jgi:hypothetical protein